MDRGTMKVAEMEPAAIAALPKPSTGSARYVWTEVKTTLLPWLVAAAVVIGFVLQQRQVTADLMAANSEMGAALRANAAALEVVATVVREQGLLPLAPGSGSGDSASPSSSP